VRLDESCERVFARHETFHPRYGWLKKAYEAGARTDDLFNRADAVVTMGVGKNMVKSIRHWGMAFKVLEQVPVAGSRRPTYGPSTIGRAWFDDDFGVDPFMELPGTDWLMHWWLLAPMSQAPVWWIALNEFSAIEFTEEELTQFVLDRVADFGNANASSVRKDVSVFLRMYSSGHNARATFEDRIDCPFRELGLIQPSTSDRSGYRFLVGAKPTLPGHVFAAAVTDFVHRTGSTAQTINLSRALTEPGSPGRVFRLTDEAVLDLLTDAASGSSVFAVVTSAGAPQIKLEVPPREATNRLLAEHYRRYGRTLSFQTAITDQEPAA
jgi:hypothetical protein